MDDYTPSTEDVRESYTYFRGTIPTVEHAAEFDAWLLRVQAEAWEAGYADGGRWPDWSRCDTKPLHSHY